MKINSVVRAYLVVSSLDHFADMILAVTSVLLLKSLGMDSRMIFATIAGVWLVEALFEVPTGIIADMIGRRRSVLVSFAMRAAGYSALFFSDSIGVAVAGTFIGAVGGTFYSGALEAWAVDEAGEGEDLDRLFSWGRVAENTGLLLGVMLGAAAGRVDLALPQLLAGGSCALAGILAAFLMNETAPEAEAGCRAFGAKLKDSTLDILSGVKSTMGGDRVLIGLVLGTALLWLFRGVPGIQWAPAFERTAGGNLLLLGVMRGGSALLEIPLLIWIMKIHARGGQARSWIIAGGAAAGGAFLAAAALADAPPARMAAYVCFSLTLGVCMPGIRAAMNERIDPRHRATALSVASLFNSLFTGGGLIAAGWAIGEIDGVRVSWPLAAIGFAAAGALTAALASPVKADEPRAALAA